MSTLEAEPGPRSVEVRLRSSFSGVCRSATTFRELAERWASGELERRFPDHVRAKDHAHDVARLGKLYGVDVGGVALGDVPLAEFTLDHAEMAMGRLPSEARRPGTRRHYAQLIQRVLALAVYPCRIVRASPLPRGWVPRPGRPPAHPYLYPDEDARLMACTEVPLCWRVLWGFLAREGLRVGEALKLRFGFEVDLDRGVVSLDENKTNDARAWALDPGCARALRAWSCLRGAVLGDLVFVGSRGTPLTSTVRLAERLRTEAWRRARGARELGVPRVSFHGERRARRGAPTTSKRSKAGRS